MIQKICNNCKKEFIGQNIKYCSNKCYHLSRIGKPTWNKGITGYKCHSEEWKKILSERRGEKSPHWLKRKEKMCLNCKNIFLVKEKYYNLRKFCCKDCSKEYMKGKNHPMFRKKHSFIAKKLISIKNKGKRRTFEMRKKFSKPGMQNGMYGKRHTNLTKMLCRKARLQQTFPLKETQIEMKLFYELSKRNIEFVKHKNILGITQPDAFIHPNICIYADGDYWHNYPTGRDKDKEIDNKLMTSGYIVFRFWERDINANISECIDKITEGMQNSNY